MSRSKKGAKGCGWETWSKRPGSCFPPGRIGKSITNSKERMARKKEIKKAMENVLEQHKDTFDKLDDNKSEINKELENPFKDLDISLNDLINREGWEE